LAALGLAAGLLAVGAGGADVQASSAPRVGEPIFVQAVRRRLVLVGDSIVHDLCPLFYNATCITFPGAWVAAVDGENIVDGFVTRAKLTPNDTVVLSSVGAYHSIFVDDEEIITRLKELEARIVSTGAKLIVLVAPKPNFELCTRPSTPEERALYGPDFVQLCDTGEAIAAYERTWPVTKIEINGPYVADGVHQTPAAQVTIMQKIFDAI
jgi:hypothetical protein